MNRRRRYVNIFIAVGTVGSWLSMFYFGVGELAKNGVESLKYFTVLSNLFAGIAAVIWLVSERKNGKASLNAERLKYVAATSVALTFAVVMFFLGPLYGYLNLLQGGNFFLHLIIPVVCVLEIIFMTDTAYTWKDNALAVLPALAYGIAYLVNILINGAGTWPDTNDWYQFFAWGYSAGMLIYAGILVTTWLLGLMMRKLQQLYRS